MDEIGAFYKKLYSTSFDEDRSTEIDVFIQETEIPKLTTEQKEEIDNPVTKQECFDTLKTMQPNKSPGLDGLPSEFYRVFWVDISDLLMEVYNYSFTQGKLSISQRRSIISLLPKKDRDLLKIKNYRPITLLTVDYKIIAKCIATRIKGVLKSLVHPDQSGFIQGRHIGDNIRTIIDIINHTANKKIPGAILLLDIEKAFDSLERLFMEKCLKAYNFGNNIIQWISTFYKDRSSQVLNFGHMTDSFNLERGVFQGCPLSPYIFILAIEVLALRIRQGRDIKGIRVGEIEKKISLFADDATIFTEGDNTSFTNIFNLLGTFGRVSGCKMNLSKTQAIWIGSKRDSTDKPFENQGIQWNPNVFTCLGINIAVDLQLLFQLNFTPRLDKLGRLVQIWSSRKLTLIGKVTVIKTFLLPQFLYLFSVLPVHIPKAFYKKIESTLYKFLWSNKKDKVKRDSMIGDYPGGGLNMVHIESFGIAQQIFWVQKLLDNRYESIWKSIELESLTAFNQDPFLLFKCNPSQCTLNKIKCMSVQVAIASWNHYKHKSIGFEQQSIWYNKYFRTGVRKKSDLYKGTWLPKGIKYVCDIMVDGRFFDFEELKLLYDIPEVDRATFSRIVDCISSNRGVLDNFHVFEETTNEHMLEEIVIKKASRHSYDVMRAYHYHLPVSKFQKWETEVGNIPLDGEWRNINDLQYKCCIETKMRAFYFRLLHHILPNNEFLYKVGIVESDLCTFCEENIETICHYLCMCPLTVIFWTEVLGWIKSKTSIELSMDPAVLIFAKDVPANQQAIRFILLCAKYFIYLCRIRQTAPSFNVFLVQLKAHQNIEYKIAQRKGMEEKHVEKWYFEM